MSDYTESTKMDLKFEKLKGSENFEIWDLGLTAVLMNKDFDSFIEHTPPLQIPPDEKRNRKLAWMIIIQSITPQVYMALSSLARDKSIADPYTLYNELKRLYYSTTGPRITQLLSDLSLTRFSDSEDPNSALGKIRQAYSQLGQCGVHLPQMVLAHYLLMALPPAYSSLRQTLQANEKLEPETVMTSITNEYQTRKSLSQDSNAYFGATFNRNHNQRNYHNNRGNNQHQQNRQNRMFSQNRSNNQNGQNRNSNMFCTFHNSASHWTKDCRNKGNPNGYFNTNSNTQANNTTTFENTQFHEEQFNNSASITEVNSFETASAFVSTSICLNSTSYSFIIDSGADRHMVNNQQLLQHTRICAPIAVSFGNGQSITSTIQGKLDLGAITLDNVLFVPGLKHNLISVSQTPGQWVFDSEHARLHYSGTTMLSARRNNNLYQIVNNSPNSQNHWGKSGQSSYDISANVAASNLPSSDLDSAHDSLQYWHRKLGHLNIQSLLKLQLPNLPKSAKSAIQHFQCQSCIQGKGKRLPAPDHAVRACKPLALVHVDIWGPATSTSIGGARYFLTCYDDFSRKVIIYFLKAKSEVPHHFNNYLVLVQHQTGHQINQVRSDNGGEFISAQFQQIITRHGIQHIRVPPGAHSMNGRVERVHLTILNGVRTLLVENQHLPTSIWAEAASYIVYTRNKSPSGPSQTIPDQLWNPNNSINYNLLQPFGQTVFYREHKQINKLQPRFLKGYMVGYTPEAHSYRIYDPTTKTVIVTRDCVWPKQQDTFTKATVVNDIPDQMESQQKPSTSKLEIAIQPPKASTKQHTLLDPNHSVLDENQQELHHNNQQDESQQHTPPSSPDPLAMNSDDEIFALIANSSGEPSNYSEAINSPESASWKAAIKDELDKMTHYQVWTVVPKSGQRVVTAKWVFTRKLDGKTGKPSKYKARWVARGFTQRKGIDYNELFSSVVHKDTLRLFLALVNYWDLECHQVDIKAAFLNGELEETIYCAPPEGSNIDNGKFVLKLNKSLYGLKQSPRCFNQKLDSWFCSKGLIPTTSDSCIYYSVQNNTLLLLCVHVDDQLIASNNLSTLKSFKSDLDRMFECEDGGEADFFLKFNILRNRQQRILQISQQHYLRSLLTKFNMENCNSVSTPLPVGFSIARKPTEDEIQEAKDLPFPQLAGSLLYAATISRPDLMFAASTLCAFISSWNVEIWKAAKHTLRYIQGTLDFCLTFNPATAPQINTSCPLLGYCDADWASNKLNRRSTTGYAFTIYGALICWKSRLQPTVALSTTEAEYMASTNAACQAIWLSKILSDFKIPAQPIILFNDNMGSVLLAQNPIYNEKSKHIDIKHHFIREKVQDGAIKIQHIASKLNLADFFTKQLPKDQFNILRAQLGIQKCIL